ncbi:GNAT family N-acetyltransferase [Clostridium sp.]|uniref:GNAT family N-acetyltransferase n=1 Tax=Clostridium sp. TaxID=1506 RepID=UPI001DA9B4D0|nr:GNAT family N-acetyltransferase [Clostridium sp.]MBS5937564.1 GNAT family N-acetyltransferase [Clostridium sp.]
MLEKLTLHNMDIFKEIYSKNFEEINYNKDFFKSYDSQNFLIKFLYRKSIRLIKVNEIYIGYIWYESTSSKYTKVWALYIDFKYMGLLNKNILSIFNNNLLSYEALDTLQNSIVLESLGFTKKKYTLLLKLNLKTYEDKKDEYIKEVKFKLRLNNTINFYTRIFEPGKDEILRCDIQNDIFEQWNRLPLNTEDIYADMAQDYYINELCIFAILNNEYVGYGQIIYNRSMFTIVNFGIVSKYRGLGFGNLFLNEMIEYAKNYGIDNLYIRVDSDNIKAINLYRKIGFLDENKVLVWER